ncbi:unnamed protein product [Pleuronectes platessa]|uniref:Uncharacterized protein n=1 Tax=Pleuronectes platessa TaxID=8262 RepID=A0A9N7V959_PLEPL|nr:unnamed protein product [Pleuronectes platessa]
MVEKANTALSPYFCVVQYVETFVRRGLDPSEDVVYPAHKHCLLHGLCRPRKPDLKETVPESLSSSLLLLQQIGDLSRMYPAPYPT